MPKVIILRDPLNIRAKVLWPRERIDPMLMSDRHTQCDIDLELSKESATVCYRQLFALKASLGKARVLKVFNNNTTLLWMEPEQLKESMSFVKDIRSLAAVS